ncbi:MAG: hypothetical protein FWC09_01720 [Lachnospiraceae bacterium]|nr:hypothetical protein [Lachnospiraceae bacterium]
MVDFIEQNKMDVFFDELTNIFIYALENGLAYIHEYSIELENEHTLLAVKKGLDCVQEGLLPLVVKTILETSNLLTLKSHPISEQEMLELKLLEKIILYIQSSEIQAYINLLSRLCTRHSAGVIENRMKKYISMSSD